MKIARLTGLMLIAIFAMSLMAASVATAEPAFNPASGTFSGTSGTSILSANNAVDVVTCEKDVSAGQITGATTVAGVTVHFLNCTSTGPGGSNCAINSVGSPSGLIITSTLDGVLGLVLPKPSSGGVGLELLPSSGTVFVTLSSNACTTETTKVTGNVVGEATPLNSKQLTGKLNFTASGSKAGIKGFDPDGGSFLTAKLTAYTAEASETTAESVTFAAATEIT